MENRRVLTGVLAGVLAAGLIISVAFGAYRAGERSEVVTRVAGEGEVVRVIDDSHRGGHWGYGPGSGFFLFPLIGIGLVVLLVSRGRRGGYGPGWCGPGPGNGPQARMEDWHRRAHEQPPMSGSSASAPPTS